MRSQVIQLNINANTPKDDTGNFYLFPGVIVGPAIGFSMKPCIDRGAAFAQTLNIQGNPQTAYKFPWFGQPVVPPASLPLVADVTFATNKQRILISSSNVRKFKDTIVRVDLLIPIRGNASPFTDGNGLSGALILDTYEDDLDQMIPRDDTETNHMIPLWCTPLQGIPTRQSTAILYMNNALPAVPLTAGLVDNINLFGVGDEQAVPGLSAAIFAGAFYVFEQYRNLRIALSQSGVGAAPMDIWIWSNAAIRNNPNQTWPADSSWRLTEIIDKSEWLTDTAGNLWLNIERACSFNHEWLLLTATSNAANVFAEGMVSCAN